MALDAYSKISMPRFLHSLFWLCTCLMQVLRGQCRKCFDSLAVSPIRLRCVQVLLARRHLPIVITSATRLRCFTTVVL